MRLQVMSDLHFEWHHDHGRSFAASIIPAAPILILAGDIVVLQDLEHFLPVLTVLCAKFEATVYIDGNHEWYGLPSVDAGRVALARLAKMIPRFHVLRNSVVEIDGRRFLGGNMWFPDSRHVRKNAKYMSDAKLTPGYPDWCCTENSEFIAFLEQHLSTNDVVVTHTLPSQESIATKYLGSHLNCFFLSDVEQILRTRSPKLWIHGHTHESCDYQLGATRVVCNPFGYVGQEENPRFDEQLVVEC